MSGLGLCFNCLIFVTQTICYSNQKLTMRLILIRTLLKPRIIEEGCQTSELSVPDKQETVSEDQIEVADLKKA